MKFKADGKIKKVFRSLPSWECGLKSLLMALMRVEKQSLPSWECGLKFFISATFRASAAVTPFVGVWIEIEFADEHDYEKSVTPFVGVWIEINFSVVLSGTCKLSLPSWECGLKCLGHCLVRPEFVSLPSWECGLKFFHFFSSCLVFRHSLRGSVD